LGTVSTSFLLLLVIRLRYLKVALWLLKRISQIVSFSFQPVSLLLCQFFFSALVFGAGVHVVREGLCNRTSTLLNQAHPRLR